MKVSPHPVLVSLLMLVAVVTAGLVGTAGYAYLSAATLAQQVATQRTQLQAGKDRVTRSRTLQAQSKQLAGKIARHPASWSWSEQLPIMVTQVSQVVENDGVKIETLQPEPLVVRQQIARFPLRMTLHTRLGSLTEVLQRIRQSQPILAIDRLHIRNAQKPGDPLMVDLTLSSFVVLEGARQTGGGK